MTFHELANKILILFPGVLLEKIISHKIRKKIKMWSLIVLVILFILMILSTFWGTSTGLEDYIFKIRGTFFLVFSFWLIFYLLDLMYFSFYFKEDSPMDFEVAKIIANTKPEDVTVAFLQSEIGRVTMIRLGIPIKDLINFIKERKSFVTADEYYVIENDNDPYITIAEYARSIIHFDTEFANFLKINGIDANVFKGAIEWVARNQRKSKKTEAWWHKENLQRIPSIGRNWAYGQIYYLEKFGHPIYLESSYKNMDQKSRLYEEHVRNMERILLKGIGANVMLISTESEQALNVVSAFGKEIAKGTVHHEIEGKRVYVLDGNSIIDGMEDKINFEKQINGIFIQAANAGNVILVIPDLPSFISSAHAIEVEVTDLLKVALESQRLNVIAVANSRGFHESVETNHDLMRHFEKIILPEQNDDTVLELIEDEAMYVERREPVIFTYQALESVIQGASRYFADSSLSEKAVDIVHEVATLVSSEKRTLVKSSDVEILIEKRTGIPQGGVDKEEQNKLTNLEKILHERIIGQDIAINAISTSLRRARAGLTDPKRPMGSFLFLGPTGVGKTETTKALASTFFEDENKIIRIDMSEYSSDEALEKLIGSFETKQPGILASKLRENQYGVLLLDEFEKASSNVHDLFLQILDEGYFTDGRGEKVNARNLIIIATSNAGSDIIYEATKNGDNNLDSNEIIDKIIERGIFRPELINRFDGAIVFHSLAEEDLRKVAKLMLNSLEERLSNKNLKINQTTDLINYLIKIGNDQKFGARAMKRAIQDEVEKVIANGLIAGSIKVGDAVTLKVEGRGLILS